MQFEGWGEGYVYVCVCVWARVDWGGVVMVMVVEAWQGRVGTKFKSIKRNSRGPIKHGASFNY